MVELGESTKELKVRSGPASMKYSKARERYPLLKDPTRFFLDTGGEVLVSDKPLDSKMGLMRAAEELVYSDKTADLKDQAKVALFQGAAVALTNAVLGYPGINPVKDIDGKIWNERFQTEEAYLHELFEDRKEIPNKEYAENEEGAAVNLVYVIELAQSLSPEDQRKYLEEVAERRAINNLGVGENREAYREAVQRRVAKELEYLQGAIRANSASHGRKNLTYVGEKQKTG